ncbi:glycosyltransferase family 1 protein [Clostridium botulinum]|uniref:glycosyltransferase n=1 Tax=Clostridium botulinum TaxID=1491 RepID=UPI000774BDE9|nr:glycosyltransferase [Clostridium botulinum]MCS6111262.1 glycosyltransferase family 1 protein [Clostridium botulinum]NFE10851.1 glycosyltransferase family 1 protein [Clostridium botulinum]NFL41537.1 glycosyltransferase family 1 protein [Clostridium botulinum]NFN23227.1 glycosyltransferase family 1 protein [Clostridium botulinum]NFN41027.1 glycosyltransferase family 1 protein [Clostridium botulinum]
MKKILFVASTLSHIENFHIPYLKKFKDNGFSVHVMGKVNNKTEIPYVDKIIPIEFKKNMFSIKNFHNSIKIRKHIKKENYNIIYLHTTLAAFFTRLSIMTLFKKPELIINTVHGYLFDDNTKFIKKSIMILAEKFVKCVTDTIIVMNSTDYNTAKKYNLFKNNIYLINGMGINTENFSSINPNEKLLLRKENAFSDKDFILIYVAEFSKRKNQIFLINSLKKLIDEGFSDIKLLLLGDGKMFDNIKNYSDELGIIDNIIFTGYTKKTCMYYQLSDVCVSSSRIEGLPFNIVEAMSTGLPIVASNIKGHSDLVKQNKNGYLFEYNNVDEFCDYIKKIYCNKELQCKMRISSSEISKKYALQSVLNNTIDIISDEYISIK